MREAHFDTAYAVESLDLTGTPAAITSLAAQSRRAAASSRAAGLVLMGLRLWK